MNARTLLRLAAANCLHQIMIVAHQDEAAAVDAGRVGEFEMSMPGGERSDGRVESRRVAQPGIFVASRGGAGRAAERAAARCRRAKDRLGGAFLFRPHPPRGIHFRADDMAMHIDAAGHDDQARGVERSRRAERSDRWAAATIRPPSIHKSRTCPSMPLAGS